MNKIKQQIPVYFDAGLDQKTDDVFSQGLHKAENAEYKKAGSISKRDGFVALSNETIPFYDIGVISQSVDVYASASFFSPERTSWYTPLHVSGTLTAVTGGQVQNLYHIAVTSLTNFTSSWSGLPSWLIYQDLTTGSADLIIKHIGYKRSPTAANGNRSAYFRIRNDANNNIKMSNFGDWSIPQSTDQYGPSATSSWTISDTAQLKYWITTNEYAQVCMISSSTGWFSWYLGEFCSSQFIREDQRGVAFLTENVSSGSNVVLNVDREVAGSFHVGENIMIVNQTPSGSNAVSGAISVQPITALGATSITVANLTKPHVSGAIMGIFPVRPIIPTAGNTALLHSSRTFHNNITPYGTASNAQTWSNDVPAYTAGNEFQSSTKTAHLHPFFRPTLINGINFEAAGLMYHILISQDYTDASNNSFLHLNGDYDQIYKCFSRYECNNLGTTDHTWIQVYPTSGNLGVQ